MNDEEWVIDFLREHGYPFSDYDAAMVENVFAEYFAAHDPHFNEERFRDACTVAVDVACDRWEEEQREKFS